MLEKCRPRDRGQDLFLGQAGTLAGLRAWKTDTSDLVQPTLQAQLIEILEPKAREDPDPRVELEVDAVEDAPGGRRRLPGLRRPSVPSSATLARPGMPHPPPDRRR